MTRSSRTTRLALLFLTTTSITLAQSLDPSKPSKEYIRLGGQIIAIENGQPSGPAVGLSPASLTFGGQNVNSTSASQSVTVTNSGNAALTVSVVSVTGTHAGDFSSTNTCVGSSIAAGGTCMVTVTFTPTAAGNRSASLSITDNAADSPQSVALNGLGIALAPGVMLSPVNLTFASQNIGTTSAGQAITITNSGNAALTVSAVTVAGTNGADFSSTNTCIGSSIAPAATCTITVTFAPTMAGNRSASLTIADNAATSPQAVALSGTGTVPGATLSTANLAFGNQNITTASASQTVTITSSGTGPLTVSAVNIGGANSGDFTSTTTCVGSNIAPASTCVVTVTFKPTATGPRIASLTITDNAAGSPQCVALTGTGTVPLVTLSTASLAFGNQNTGTASASQTITVKNSGTGPLTITSVATGGANAGDFSISGNTCGAPVAAGASCTISVAFKPTALGNRTGSVLLTDNAAGSPQAVTVTGNGTAPIVTLSTTSLSFGNQVVGTTCASQTVTLKNTGTGPLTITSVATGGANASDFIVTGNTCGATVAAGVSCTLSVAFRPTAMGSRTGSVQITDNAAGSPQSIALSGTGLAPVVTLSATSLTFGNQNSGTASASQTITVKNTGTAALLISSITIGGANAGDFSFVNNCGPSIAVGASRTVVVTFKPTAVGSRTASLLITDDAAGSPQSVALSGTGTAPVVSLSPASLAFGTQKLKTTSASKTITVRNTGTGPLAISSVATTGASAGCFLITANSCGSSVAAGATCTVSVAYRPTVAAVESANLAITDNAAGSPQTVALSGQGVK